MRGPETAGSARGARASRGSSFAAKGCWRLAEFVSFRLAAKLLVSDLHSNHIDSNDLPHGDVAKFSKQKWNNFHGAKSAVGSQGAGFKFTQEKS